MAQEQLGSPEQNESGLLHSIVDNGKVMAEHLQQKFGRVFYPMKFVKLPTCNIAYGNPGGDHPMSLRIHQVIDGQAAGVEVGLFFRTIPGAEGQELRLFEDGANRSSISSSSGSKHAYHFIQQNIDGSLLTVPGAGSEQMGIEELQAYNDFVQGLIPPFEAALQTST